MKEYAMSHFYIQSKWYSVRLSDHFQESNYKSIALITKMNRNKSSLIPSHRSRDTSKSSKVQILNFFDWKIRSCFLIDQKCLNWLQCYMNHEPLIHYLWTISHEISVSMRRGRNSDCLKSSFFVLFWEKKQVVDKIIIE